MRRMAYALLVPFLMPLVAQANPPCGTCNPFPWRLDTGLRFNFQLVPAGGTQLGPWYNYWPMEAHFQTPAPPAYPYWPQGGAGGMGPGGPGGSGGSAPPSGPNVMAPAGPAQFHAAPVVPVGYQRYAVPSYWGR